MINNYSPGYDSRNCVKRCMSFVENCKATQPNHPLLTSLQAGHIPVKV